MTDHFNDDDRQKAHQDKSFKEQILEKMRQASQEREARLAQEEKERQAAALASRVEEEARLEQERQTRLAEEERRRQQEQEVDSASPEEEARAHEHDEALADVTFYQPETREHDEQSFVAYEQVMDDLPEPVSPSQEPTAAELEAERVAIGRELERDSQLTQTVIPDLNDGGMIDFDSLDLDGYNGFGNTVIIERSTLTDLDLMPEDLAFTSDQVEFDEELFADNDIDPDEDYIVADDAFRQKRRQATTGLARRISLVLGTSIVVLLLATSILGYTYISSAIGPLDKTATDYVQVEIPSGYGGKLIGQLLEEKGVIKSGTVFNYYTKFKNYGNFQSGYYNFQKSMSLEEIAKLLQEGGTPEPVLPTLGKIVIPEGYTLTQIAKAVALNGATEDKNDASPFSEAEFLALVQNPEVIARMTEKYPNLLASLPDASEVTYQLEGYLFPATYAYTEATTLEGLLDEMLAAMDNNLAPYYATIEEKGMTVNEILTLASLVEKEGKEDDDRQKIASVFYNRLSIDMPLQSNIAILYAMGKLGEETTLAEDAAIDTAIESPYNIYATIGLMPGPVDSPSLKAIQATITPAQTDYLYFVADVTTGQVYYAETYEDHEVNVEQYVNQHLNQE